MPYVPVLIKSIDDVAEMADVDGRLSNDMITSCPTCFGIVLYQVVTHHYEGTDMATDTTVYCARCGQQMGGIILDPFEELDEMMRKKPQSLSEKVNEE